MKKLKTYEEHEIIEQMINQSMSSTDWSTEVFFEFVDNHKDTLNGISSNGSTLLMNIIIPSNEDKELIKWIQYLFDAGGDKNINQLSSTHNTVLLYAAFYVNKQFVSNHIFFDVVNLLSDYDANWNFKDAEGFDFFHYLIDEDSEYLINKYPDKYKKYIREKKAKKFKI